MRKAPPLTELEDLGRGITLWPGDCLACMASLPENSLDAVICDPPYHLTSGSGGGGFMGKAWDGGDIAFRKETWALALRALKPGGHLAAFSGSRTYHRMAVAIEDAGFEVRDMLSWIYGSGFPKSLDVSKAIDKALGAERVAIATGAPVKRMIPGATQNSEGWEKSDGRTFTPGVSLPATPDAAEWSGYGTALKPAHEPICLARKPLSEPNVAANVLRWGTGALNVDGGRVEAGDGDYDHPGCETRPIPSGVFAESGYSDTRQKPPHSLGRWPANVCHDGSDEVLAGFPITGPTPGSYESVPKKHGVVYAGGRPPDPFRKGHASPAGAAARFFYCAKADDIDRCGSRHPTVKPVALMRWLARMLVAPGGRALDPFAGSGATGAACALEGFAITLCEREADYQADIRRRVKMLSMGEFETTVARVKARAKTADPGPLFGDLADSGGGAAGLR